MSATAAYLQKHILICTDESSCGGQHGARVRKELKHELRARDLRHIYRDGECSCLGLCRKGVNAVIWPEGTYLAGLTEDDIPRLVDYLEGKGARLTDLEALGAEKIELKKQEK